MVGRFRAQNQPGGQRRRVGIRELEGRKMGGERRNDGGREEGGRRGSRRED